MTQIQNKYIS